MKMVFCQVSRMWVLPKSDGACPSCGEQAAGPRHAQEAGEGGPIAAETGTKGPGGASPKAGRPVSVTVISFLLAFLGIFVLFSVAMVLVPWWRWWVIAFGGNLWISVPIASINGIVLVVSAIAMMKGHGWGRLLYLSWQPLVPLLFWVFYGFRPGIPMNLGLYAVTAAFLLRRKASDYFAGPRREEELGGSRS